MEAKYKIYVVDDDPFNLMLVVTRLRRVIDCEVKKFENAESCIRAIEEDVPDLVVTDYRLHTHKEHGMNGDQMMQHIKNDYPDLPVVIYSHSKNMELAVQFMKEGAADFVQRDRHFLNRVTSTVQKQLSNLKEKYDVIWGKISIILLISLFSGSLFFIYNTSEIWLKYYIFAITLIIAVFIFFGEWIFINSRRRQT